MSKQKTPNTDIEYATRELEVTKLVLDFVEPEQFDKETLRAFIATCNEIKLSAVKTLRVLDKDNQQPETMEMKPSVAAHHLLENYPSSDNPVLQNAVNVAVKALRQEN